MHRRVFRGHSDGGVATVEMALLGTLVLTVLVQVVVLFGQVHRAMLAASAASRELGRVVVLADDEEDARQRGADVVSQAAVDHGLPPDALHARVEGTVARGAEIRVIVDTEVAVVGVAGLGIPGLRIPVHAEHVVVVDRYRSFEP